MQRQAPREGEIFSFHPLEVLRNLPKVEAAGTGPA
jgi:hypothetical protein